MRCAKRNLAAAREATELEAIEEEGVEADDKKCHFARQSPSTPVFKSASEEAKEKKKKMDQEDALDYGESDAEEQRE